MPLPSLEKPDKQRMSRRGEKRYALIMAGLKLFGKHGLEATTTRMLAEESGANIAAIPYYFGSKDGLYLAVMEYITERIDDHIGDALNQLEQRLGEGDMTVAEARTSFKEMMIELTRMLVESDEPKAWAQIIMREQLNPSAAFEIFYQRHMRRLQHLMHQLVAICTQLDVKSSEVKLRTHALLGQMLIFLISRETLLRGLKCKKMSKAQMQEMRKVLATHIDACLRQTVG